MVAAEEKSVCRPSTAHSLLGNVPWALTSFSLNLLVLGAVLTLDWMVLVAMLASLVDLTLTLCRQLSRLQRLSPYEAERSHMGRVALLGVKQKQYA